MANQGNIVVKSTEELYAIMENVEKHLDGLSSERKELLAKADANSAQVQETLTRLTQAEDSWKEVKARLDKMDALLPKGEKIYLPANGDDAKSERRQEIARFLLDGMAYELTGKTICGSEEFQRALTDTGQSYKPDGTDNVGGYLVPDLYRTEIIRIASTYGLARQLFKVVPMQGYVMHMPTHLSGPDVEWFGDAGTALQPAEGASTANEPATGENLGPTDLQKAKFGRVALRTSRLMAVDTLSIEITEWAVPTIADFLIDVFAEKIAQAEDTAAFIGDGTATYGGFTGMLNAAGTVVVTLGGAAGSGKTLFADLRYSDLVNMIDAPNEFTVDSGVWIMSNSIANLIRKLRENENDNTGRPLWSELGTEMLTGRPPSIFGRPYYRTPVLPKQGDTAADKKFLIYGDPRYCFMGDSMSLRVDFSEHTDFKKGNIAMRVLERVGFVVALGSPIAVLKTSAT